MNRLEFKIEDWIEGDDPDPRRAGTSAEFILLINDVPATRLYDNRSRTVTDRARLPLYPLAEWLAVNWWRLHAEASFEAGSRPPADWRLCHDLPGIGGGLVWPRVRFASDDTHIIVSARAIRNAPWEPVRHLNDIPPTPISKNDFDLATSDLIFNVLARLDALAISAEPLATIWKDVREEQADPELLEWRIWEARLGYDPDRAPQHLMSQITDLFSHAGKKAALEVVPLIGDVKSTSIEAMELLASTPGFDVHPIVWTPNAGTSELWSESAAVEDFASALDFDVRPLEGRKSYAQIEPWNKGRLLAKKIRNHLSIRSGPIEDGRLLDFLGSTSGDFDQVHPVGGALSLGVRSPSDDRLTLHFRKRNRPGVRFEAARFLCEIITADVNDLWLPQTNRGTARQKMQRAFAAEFLLPIDEAVEQMGDDFAQENLEEVGDRYGVSSMAVRSHLANHGYLNP